MVGLRPQIERRRRAGYHRVLYRFYRPVRGRQQADVRKHVSTCDACQRCKRQKKKYGHLPAKEPERGPWERLCIDLIGPYTIRRKNKKGEKKKKNLILHAMTMIDPVTGWFEIAQIKNKTAEEVSSNLEMTWLSRYPWPQVIQMGQRHRIQIV